MILQEFAKALGVASPLSKSTHVIRSDSPIFNTQNNELDINEEDKGPIDPNTKVTQNTSGVKLGPNPGATILFPYDRGKMYDGRKNRPDKQRQPEIESKTTKGGGQIPAFMRNHVGTKFVWDRGKPPNRDPLHGNNMSRHLKGQQSNNKRNDALVALDENTNKGSSVNLAVGKARMMAGSNSPKLMNNIWDPADLTMITSTSSPANCLSICVVRTPTAWMNLFSEGDYEAGDGAGKPNHVSMINTPYDRGKFTPMTLKTKLFLAPHYANIAVCLEKFDLVLFLMSENLNNLAAPYCWYESVWRGNPSRSQLAERLPGDKSAESSNCATGQGLFRPVQGQWTEIDLQPQLHISTPKEAEDSRSFSKEGALATSGEDNWASPRQIHSRVQKTGENKLFPPQTKHPLAPLMVGTWRGSRTTGPRLTPTPWTAS